MELKIIGYVHNEITNLQDRNWGKVVSRIDLLPEYAAGITGIEQFSHIIVLFWMHNANYSAESDLVRHPRDRLDLPLSGIFAQRAKSRPNPIGITAVKLVETAPSALIVQGLDAIDGTPVIDLKPYVPSFDYVENPIVPLWISEIMSDYFQ